MPSIELLHLKALRLGNVVAEVVTSVDGVELRRHDQVEVLLRNGNARVVLFARLGLVLCGGHAVVRRP